MSRRAPARNGSPPATRGMDRPALRQAARDSGLELVVLFGSRARGDARAGSDLDLAVLWSSEADALTEMRLGEALARAFPHERVSVANLNAASPLLQAEVAGDGRPLFEARPGESFATFASLAVRTWDEGERLHRLSWEYASGRLESGPMRKRVVVDSIRALTQYVAELDDLSQVTLEEYVSDLRARRSIERALQLVIESAVDAAVRMLVWRGQPPPEESRQAIRDLQALGVVDAELADRICGYVGIRNRLVHEYGRIRDDMVYAAALIAGRDFDLFRQRLVDAMPDTTGPAQG